MKNNALLISSFLVCLCRVANAQVEEIYPTTSLSLMQPMESGKSSMAESVGPDGSLHLRYQMGNANLSYCSGNGGRWQVDVLAITRSTKFGPPKYDDSDLFLFDGMELIYDTAKGVYHTVSESYRKIEYCNRGTEGSYWKVTDTDGSVRFFGINTDGDTGSRIEPVGIDSGVAKIQPRAWALAERDDAALNETIRYNYVKYTAGSGASGDYYLASVVKGKSKAAQNGFSGTRLYYEDDPNPQSSYVEGSLVKGTKRVKVVEVVQGCAISAIGGIAREAYKIDWGAQTEYLNSSVVRSIAKYGAYGDFNLVVEGGSISGGIAQPPTTFSYTKLLDGNSASAFSSTPMTWDSVSTYLSHGSLRTSVDPASGTQYNTFNTTAEYLDFNGDGLPDRLVQDNSAGLSVFLNKGDKTGFASTAIVLNTGIGTDLAMENPYGKGTERMIVDFNGDGLPDRLSKANGDSKLLFFRNNGQAFDPAIEICQASTSALRMTIASSTRSNVVNDVLDMNGDGLLDWVMMKPETSTYPIKVQIMGSKLEGSNEWIPYGSVPWNFAFYPTIVELIGKTNMRTLWSFLDINGDGLPDRLWQNSAGLNICFNTSRGFTESCTWDSFGRSISYGLYQLGEIPYPKVSEDYIDINGDGLLDRVWSEFNSGGGVADVVKIRFNTGCGFGATLSIPGGIGPGTSQILRSSGGTSDGLSMNTYSGFMDMDGDGLADRVQQGNTSALTIYRNCISYPSEALLTKVVNACGGTVSYKYLPATEYRNPGYKAKEWVVGSTTVGDGLGSLETTSYTYENGRYCTSDRTDWGFGLVARTDPEGTVTETYYAHNDFTAAQLADPANSYLKGAVWKVVKKNATGKVFSSTVTSYANGVGTSSNYGYGVSLAASGLRPAMSVYAQQVASVDAYTIDGMCGVGSDGIPTGTEDTQWRHSRIEYAGYDKYGNVTLLYSGSHPGAAWGKDKKEAATSYRCQDASGIWIFLPYEAKVKQYDSAGTLVDSGRTLYYYDGSSATNSVVTKGLLTRVDSYYDASHCITTSKTYDSYGNVATEADGRGNKASYAYDTVYCSLLLKSTPPIGALATSYEYDPVFCWPVKVTDPNGVATITKYDGFGRLVKVVMDGDTESLPTTQYEYVDAVLASNGSISTPACVITHQRIDSGQSATIDSYSYSDGLGRVVQTKSTADNESGSLAYRTQDSWAKRDGSSTRTISWQGVPYYSSTKSFDRSSSPSRSYTKASTWLDNGYGTAKESVEPSGAAARTYERVGQIVAVDANGHRTGVEATPSENRIRKYRYSGSYSSGSPFDGLSVYSTATIATSFDQSTIKDNSSNLTKAVTDWLGRKTSSSDSDSGTWSFEYDSNGNLTKKTDPAAVVTTLTYDAMNRIISKTAGSTTIAGYAYDQGGASAKALGRLTTLLFGSGTETYSYDSRGRIVSQMKTISSKTASISWSYNDLDRVKTETMPDGEKVSYTYDRGGMLGQVSGSDDANPYIKNIRYGPRGSIVSEQNGNGIATSYTYYDASGDYDQASGLDRSFRLKSISLAELRLVYGYDKAGNVRRKNINSEYEDYAYDEYDRLTSCYSTLSNPSSLSYAYNEIDNITAKGGASYTYASAHPHAATQAGTASYAYDALGNLKTRSDGLELFYDGANRLVQIKKSGTETAAFSYGAGLNRTKKKEGGTETYYFFPNYEEEYVNGVKETVKYYFADGRRIAQRRSGTSADLRTQYFHTDHLNSSVGMSDSSGLVWAMGYSPYGEDAYTIPVQGLPGDLNITGVITAQTKSYVAKERIDLSASIEGSSVISMTSGQRIVFKPGMKVKAGSKLSVKIDLNVFGDPNIIVRQRFTGQVKDDSGLYYFNARYYDPKLGRFTSPDPACRMGVSLSIEEVVNPYMYCRNNPVAFTDPMGFTDAAPGMPAVVADLIARKADEEIKSGNPGVYVSIATSAGVDGYESIDNNGTGVAQKAFEIWQRSRPESLSGADQHAQDWIKNYIRGNKGDIPSFDEICAFAREDSYGIGKRFFGFVVNLLTGRLGAASAGKEALVALRAEYEAAVKGLADRAASMRAAGATPEEIARELSAARRALGVEYKALTPADKLAEIYARNEEKYTDRLGPTVEWLREHGKSWEDIIESASRPGGQDLGF
jgi:RHS repeat-associated protein